MTMFLHTLKQDNLTQNNLGQEKATLDKVVERGFSEVVSFELITENTLGRQKCQTLKMRMSCASQNIGEKAGVHWKKDGEGKGAQRGVQGPEQAGTQRQLDCLASPFEKLVEKRGS